MPREEWDWETMQAMADYPDPPSEEPEEEPDETCADCPEYTVLPLLHIPWCKLYREMVDPSTPTSDCLQWTGYDPL